MEKTTVLKSEKRQVKRLLKSVKPWRTDFWDRHLFKLEGGSIERKLKGYPTKLVINVWTRLPPKWHG